MSNSANKKAVSMVVAAIMFTTPMGVMSIPQKPFEMYLSDSSQVNKVAFDISKNDPYVKFMEKAKDEQRMREAEKAIKESIRLEAEKKAKEAELKRTIVVNSDNGKSYSRGGAVTVKEGDYAGTFKLTAYNLSEEDCEKSSSDPYFGIASSGYDFKGKDLRCRKIAVDPNVIPMGSTVYLEFPKEFKTVTLSDGTRFELSGSYQAVDTGGAIKGNKLDLFVGGTSGSVERLTGDIGVRRVKVYR